MWFRDKFLHFGFESSICPNSQCTGLNCKYLGPESFMHGFNQAHYISFQMKTGKEIVWRKEQFQQRTCQTRATPAPIKKDAIKKETKTQEDNFENLYATQAPPKPVYHSIQEVIHRSKKLTLKNWTVQAKENELNLMLNRENTVYPECEVKIDDGLEFKIIIYGWPLPPTHQIYKNNRRSLMHTTISQLVKDVSSYTVCEGVSVQSM